jgi:hypothetical protein
MSGLGDRSTLQGVPNSFLCSAFPGRLPYVIRQRACNMSDKQRSPWLIALHEVPSQQPFLTNELVSRHYYISPYLLGLVCSNGSAVDGAPMSMLGNK